MTEKPEKPHDNLMGVGTYLLTDKVFKYARETLPSPLKNEIEITDVLSNMAKHETI